MTKFASALQQYAQAPQNDLLARSAVSAAQATLRDAQQRHAAVQQVRGQADADIAGSVDRLNDLLAQFETVNTKIEARHAPGTT